MDTTTEVESTDSTSDAAVKPAGPVHRFGEYRLDINAGILSRHGCSIPLKPKTYALLVYLLNHSGRLVSKDELLDAVWPRGFVCDSVLKVAIRDLRQVLKEDSDRPRFLHTVHRRGYRFALDSERKLSSQSPSNDSVAHGRHEPTRPTSEAIAAKNVDGVVGRFAELASLQACFQRVMQGEPQVVFVCGEAGIGRTTLVKAFCQEAVQRGAQVLRYRCRFRATQSAAYEPLAGLLRSNYNWSVRDYSTLLYRLAPTWARLLLPESSEQAFVSNGNEPSLNEYLHLLAALSKMRPVAVVVEDLQWASHYLMDFIVEFGHLDISAGLMLLATKQVGCGQQDGLGAPRLRRDLEIQGRCTSIHLERLPVTAVHQYVESRLNHPEDVDKWGQALHDLSDGHPWIMAATWQYWAETAKLSVGNIIDPSFAGYASEFAPALRLYLDAQLEQLKPEERVIIEAASVCTGKFSVANLALMIEDDLIKVEEICEQLARRHLLLRRVEGSHKPERRRASRFAFIHNVFQRMLAQGLPLARHNLYRKRLATQGL